MTDNKIVKMRAAPTAKPVVKMPAMQRFVRQMQLRQMQAQRSPGGRPMVMQTVYHPVRSMVGALMAALLATAVFGAAAQTVSVGRAPGQAVQAVQAVPSAEPVPSAQAAIAPMPLAASDPIPPLALEAAAPRTQPVRVLVVAGQESSLSAPAPGRVASVGVQLGDTVRRGQVLVAFDCSETAARRDAARTDVAAARLQHEAKIKLQGLQSAAEVEVELAAVNVDRSEAQVRVFDAQLTQCQFSAPFAGRVARVFVKPGQSVAIGAPIVDLVGTQTLKFRMNVPSRWLATLAPGDLMNAEIDETGSRHSIKVARLSARVDPVSQTVEIEAELEGKPDKLLPGMSGRAWLAAAP
jgi:RND family efflux transporter MFP subunit